MVQEEFRKRGGGPKRACTFGHYFGTSLRGRGFHRDGSTSQHQNLVHASFQL